MKTLFFLFLLIPIIVQGQKKTDEEASWSESLNKCKAAILTIDNANITIRGNDKKSPQLNLLVKRNDKVIPLKQEEIDKNFDLKISYKHDSLFFDCTRKMEENKGVFKEGTVIEFSITLNVNTKIDIKLEKGDINIKNIKTSAIKINNADGNMKILESGGFANLIASDGDIIFSSHNGGMVAETQNGKIQGDFENITDSIQMENNNGFINIIVPKETKARIFAKGKLASTNTSMIQGTIARTLISGSLNDGAMPIRLNTPKGNISFFVKE
ncbi:MAG TPA: DUF4097 family beta strand repeat-containing protein [Bacteroidales bacterium]|nr:DUF4097 family beta strand repeat-containing protein [Bacteroidales bacterium]